MTRPIRIEFPGALYHVMSRGVDGIPTFRDQTDWSNYLCRLERLVGLGVLIVHAFCLMTNHFHLLCETPIGKLSRWMQRLLSRFSEGFNHRHNREGHLWQARYKAILVEDGDYFLDCSAYIHLNPFRAGLVRAPEEYPWSSLGTYFAIGQQYEWVSTGKTLSYFGNVQEYQRFLQKKLTGEIPDPFHEAVGGIALGSSAFVETIRARVRQQGNQRDISRLAHFGRSPAIEVRQIVECVGTTCDGLSTCQKDRVLVHALRRFSGLTGRQIAALTGRSPQSISEVAKRFEDIRDEKLRTVVYSIEQELQKLSQAS